MAQFEQAAFPTLTKTELEYLAPLANVCDYADGETVFHAGQADLDLCVIASGRLEILNPTDGHRVIAGRWPRQDRDPCPLETTLPGVLVAGDLRAGSTKRVGFAVGDGSLAV